jgi:hypothetical protein
MMEIEVFDDDGRLDDRAARVDEHRHAFERPERGLLGIGLLFAEQAELERDAVLVEGIRTFWQYDEKGWA